jgi:hypothetical protein
MEIKQKIAVFARISNSFDIASGGLVYSFTSSEQHRSAQTFSLDYPSASFDLALESNVCTFRLIQVRWQDELCARSGANSADKSQNLAVN